LKGNLALFTFFRIWPFFETTYGQIWPFYFFGPGNPALIGFATEVEGGGEEGTTHP